MKNIGKLNATKEFWKRFEDLDLLKSTPNKLYLIERFFNFRMDHSKDFDDNLDF